MDNAKNIDSVLSKIEKRGFDKFGLIPEFIGRVPMVSTLNHLLTSDLIHILTEPNRLGKTISKNV